MAILSSFFWFPLPGQSQSDYPYSMNGPYIEKIEFEIIDEGQQQLLALLNDEIDMTYGKVPLSLIEVANNAENIEISHALANGYGALFVNCEKYPFNITAFRRALSFALDKEAICDDIFEGFSFPQDSVVPSINPWSIEGQLPYTYYDSNVEIGISLLDKAGFNDVDGDGFREAPDGSSFQVKIECYLMDHALQVGDRTADALSALGINAVSVPTEFYEYLPRVAYHGDYDIVLFEITLMSYDVDWMGYEFLSENAEVPAVNLFNFRNTTADSWCTRLTHARTFDEAREAAAELQELLIYECPMITCYQNFFVNPYRTDRFEGFNDIQSNNWWTHFNIKLKESLGGPYGGTLRCAIYSISTLNMMVAQADSEWEIILGLYDSLMKLDPGYNDLNWLCEGYTVQTHDDNPNIPDGHSRITFEIVKNATWTDGTPLTAEDVAFTLNYRRDTKGSVEGEDFAGIVAAYTLTPYLVAVEFNTESIWNLHSIAYKPILPKHVFQEIGVENWDTWSPNPPVEPMVTSGPFNITEHIPGEFIELTRYNGYFRGSDYEDTSKGTEATTIPNLIPALVVGTLSAAITVAIGGYTIGTKFSHENSS